jgi:hypothetical protein
MQAYILLAVASPCSGGEGVDVGAFDVELLVVDIIEGGEVGKEYNGHSKMLYFPFLLARLLLPYLITSLYP